MRAALLALVIGSSALAEPVRVSDRLGWLPIDFQMISFSSPERAAILQFIQRSLAAAAPACFAGQLKTLDLHIQAQVTAKDRSTFLFHGKLDRPALERCAREVLQAIGLSAEVRAQGAITEFATARGRSYLGWRKDWLIWDDSRERVLQLLAESPTSKLDPRMVKLLERVEPCATMCAAATLDLTSVALGVPSQGFFYSMEEGPPPRVPVTLLFASVADARRAETGLIRGGTNPKFSPAVRRLFAAVAPRAREQTLVVDIAPIFTLPPDVMRQATEDLRALVKQLN